MGQSKHDLVLRLFLGFFVTLPCVATRPAFAQSGNSPATDSAPASTELAGQTGSQVTDPEDEFFQLPQRRQHPFWYEFSDEDWVRFDRLVIEGSPNLRNSIIGRNGESLRGCQSLF